VSRVFDIHPTICCESNRTRFVDTKRRVGHETGFISLRAMMLISFSLEIPVVVIGEVPSHDGFVVDE
jgi:hypothetical protein